MTEQIYMSVQQGLASISSRNCREYINMTDISGTVCTQICTLFLPRQHIPPMFTDLRILKFPTLRPLVEYVQPTYGFNSPTERWGKFNRSVLTHNDPRLFPNASFKKKRKRHQRHKLINLSAKIFYTRIIIYCIGTCYVTLDLSLLRGDKQW